VRLLETGFHAWTRRDFTAFTRACEKYGREGVPAIAAEVDGKTEEEVGGLL
jgi:SWI/SNF-related matrix-associated actin-dependent regulator of chromatin subfamily A member 5